jgi:hypothetical protein
LTASTSANTTGKAALNSNLGLSSVTPNKLSTYHSGVNDDFFNHSLSFVGKVNSPLVAKLYTLATAPSKRHKLRGIAGIAAGCGFGQAGSRLTQLVIGGFRAFQALF